MGQQQLLLVILVTIIVGIATVVAINIFGTAAENANRDAIRQDLLSAATTAQAIWTRPEMMGGAGGQFDNLDADQIADIIGIPGTVAGAVITNENAVYTVAEPGENTLSISAVPGGSQGDWQITVLRQGNGTWLTTINDHNNQDVVMGTDETTTGG